MDLHPAIFVSHETRVFAWLHAVVNVLPESDQFVVTERERFVTHLRATLPELLRDFYEKLSPDTRYWGDKNPHYADPNNRGCLALIAELFPGTRFVNLVRDGRDVVASLVRRAHENGDPWVDFDAAHRTWITHVEIGTSFGSRQSPESYLEVRYEDFVRRRRRGREGALRVPRPGASAGRRGVLRRATTEAHAAQQPDARTAIGDLTSSDWSSVFSREEQIRSLELLGPHLVTLGYETEESIRILRDALVPKPLARSVAQPPASPAYPRRLNWGCGECGEPGWINSDIKEGPGVDISCDIRDGLAIESDSLDYVVSIHALPMISYDDLVPVLQELRASSSRAGSSASRFPTSTRESVRISPAIARTSRCPTKTPTA